MRRSTLGGYQKSRRRSKQRVYLYCERCRGIPAKDTSSAVTCMYLVTGTEKPSCMSSLEENRTPAWARRLALMAFAWQQGLCKIWWDITEGQVFHVCDMHTRTAGPIPVHLSKHPGNLAYSGDNTMPSASADLNKAGRCEGARLHTWATSTNASTVRNCRVKRK